MRLGLSLGANSVAADAAAVRDIAAAAEDVGFDRLVAADHVLGADPDRPGGWSGPYTHKDRWHEPLVLLAYVAAVTKSMELMTGVIILPQRATALVAKQAAELDVLSQGRFILGVGNGWNSVEYEALNRDFRNRGRRIEEQVALLRAVWTEPVVTFQGRYERVTQAGLNPLPTHRIPIWMGGHSEAVLDRIGRLADGWYPLVDDPSVVASGIERIRSAAERAGRDPSEIGIQARVVMNGKVREEVARVQAFVEAGATCVVAGTNPAIDTPADQISAMREFVEAVQDVAG